MQSASYELRRERIERYFDRTAADAWARLTSTEPLGRIRTTVRAGRNVMRATLLGLLPASLDGARVLDAGCGTGMLAIEAAQRGAQVVAVDLSPTLIQLARERLPSPLRGRIDFRAGDLLDESLGHFNHVVAMDSLIHYDTHDMVRVLAQLARRVQESMVLTFAPKTAALTAMHSVGRLFPRADRAPAIEPVAEAELRQMLANAPELRHWRVAATQRISSGFYQSQALQLVRA